LGVEIETGYPADATPGENPRARELRLARESAIKLTYQPTEGTPPTV